MFKVDIVELPHIRMTKNDLPQVHQPLTSLNVLKILELAGLELRMNVMAHRYEILGAGYGGTEKDQEQVLMELEDTLMMLGIGGLHRLGDLLLMLARQHGAYHPMEDWLVGVAWDKTERLAKLAASVPTESLAWPEYLRKWLIQGVEAVRGWRSGSERSLAHVLVFVGGQGAGKGRWLRALAPGYVLADAELHLSSFGSKDQQLQVLKYPLVELGEIDSTFRKSEVSALKSFLSRQVDSLRAPYARVALDRPRMTVFAGSVNSVEFLNDPTGARRFWPVELLSGAELAWDHGMDMQQVWAEANWYWEQKEDWNLEDDTEELRRQEMHGFVQQAASVDLVEAHWADYREDYTRYAVLNKTEIARVVGASTHPAELSAITGWLLGNLGSARKLQGKQRCWAYPIGEYQTATGSITCISETLAKEYVLEQSFV